MRKQLTPEEVSAVNLVTKGERFSHRRWPPEVVAAFAVADAGGAGGAEARRAHSRPRVLKKLLRLAPLTAAPLIAAAAALAGESRGD